MEFEFDPAKAAANLQKHGVSFEEGASIFGDPMSITFPDPDHSIGEPRWLSFGFARVRPHTRVPLCARVLKEFVFGLCRRSEV